VGVTWLRSTGHASHVVAVKAYNLTDEEYRLHTSLIKDLAPEIGRGIRVSYSVRFFYG
jgi:iron complex outermembrane receptor protein